MKVEVRYQSRGGNTKAVADLIAKELNVVAHSIKEPIREYVDILFLGGGVYAWNADPELIEFVRTLDNKMIGKIIVFSTAGMFDSAVAKIRQAVRERGIPLEDEGKCIKLYFRSNLTMESLSETKKREIGLFIDRVMDNVELETKGT